MENPDAAILDPSDWMSTQQLAELLDVTVPASELARHKGQDGPPWYRFGQRVRYRRSEVAAWMLKRRHVPAATQLAEASA